jgi:hypothetical protein
MNGDSSRPDDPQDRASGTSLFRVLRLPLALAAFSAAGLVSALLGDGLWDLLSWLALALPVALAIRYLVRDAGVRLHAPPSSPADQSIHLRKMQCHSFGRSSQGPHVFGIDWLRNGIPIVKETSVFGIQDEAVAGARRRAADVARRYPGREPDSFRLTDPTGSIRGVFPVRLP